MSRIALGALMFAISLPALAHVGCRDILEFERVYGKNHARNVVLVSLSSYITGYVSGLGVMAQHLAASLNGEVGENAIDWLSTGLNGTRLMNYRRLFFSEGPGSTLYNEDNYKRAVELAVDACRAEPRDTVINLFEMKVVPLMLEEQAQ